MPLIETSAKDAINVDMAFMLAVERWKALEKSLEEANGYAENTIDLNKHTRPKQHSGSCCT